MSLVLRSVRNRFPSSILSRHVGLVRFVSILSLQCRRCSSFSSHRTNHLTFPPPNHDDSTQLNSVILRGTAWLEKSGYRDVWTLAVVSKIRDRLEKPRFSFPGLFDRARPPPKTLHWQHAPAEGEFHKIRAMLCWGAIHIWLLSRRIGKDHPYSILVDNSLAYLHNELLSVWLPEASIPSFSVKGEAKRLIDECRSTLDSLDQAVTVEAVIQTIWEQGYKDRGIEVCDPVIEDLTVYLQAQMALLDSLDLTCIIENPSSWRWRDNFS